MSTQLTKMNTPIHLTIFLLLLMVQWQLGLVICGLKLLKASVQIIHMIFAKRRYMTSTIIAIIVERVMYILIIICIEAISNHQVGTI